MPNHFDPEPENDVIVVGAGIAGLCCAIDLIDQGMNVLLLEASDRAGGRVRSDQLDGYTLDRGFQTLLTTYEECQVRLDYEALGLGRFEPGALIWTGKRFSTLADPLRVPSLALKTALNPVAAFQDKLKVAALKSSLHSRAPEDIFVEEEEPTMNRLQRLGFSSRLIEGFLQPFFGSIFLERRLATTSRMFEFVFKMFGQGSAALPAEGMQAIPDQLAAALPGQTLRVGARVDRLSTTSATLATGETFNARAVVVATDPTTAKRFAPSLRDRGWNSTRCFYFSADDSPLPHPMVALNGSQRGQISNVVVPSDICSSYAPAGKSLICASSVSDSAFGEEKVRQELNSWFGEVVEKWTFLRDYRIPQALPRQEPGDCQFERAPTRSPEGLWVCGDFLHSSSIYGAMRSARKTAQALSRHLAQTDITHSAERHKR